VPGTARFARVVEEDGGIVDLTRYRWKNRLLFVFAPSAEDTRFARQWATLDEQREGVAERHLVLFGVAADTVLKTDGENLDEGAAEFLRRTFKVESGSFAVILVGKDGGEKMRSTAVVPVAEIFSVIDAMPMRQAEMRDQGR
jgi:hypothetical protein